MPLLLGRVKTRRTEDNPVQIAIITGRYRPANLSSFDDIPKVDVRVVVRRQVCVEGRARGERGAESGEKGG